MNRYRERSKNDVRQKNPQITAYTKDRICTYGRNKCVQNFTYPHPCTDPYKRNLSSKVPDEFETSDLDLDLQICHEILNVEPYLIYSSNLNSVFISHHACLRCHQDQIGLQTSTVFERN